MAFPSGSGTRGEHRKRQEGARFATIHAAMASPSTKSSFPTPASIVAPKGLAAADFDGANGDDLVIGSLGGFATPGGGFVLTNDGTGTGWTTTALPGTFTAQCKGAAAGDVDGIPNVLAEAMACGCPVVSTDCPGGPREILDHGRYGRLVPVGDVVGLTEVILEELSRQHDPEGLRQCADRFSAERSIQAYLRILFPDRRQP